MELKKYKLGDVADIVNGATPSTHNSENYDGSIIWITPKDLSDQKQKIIRRGQRNISEIGFNNCSAQMIPPYNILMSSRAPIGLLAINENECCTNQGFKNLVLDKSICDTDYVYYYLQFHMKEIEALGSGTTFKEISKSALQGLEIRLPNLEKQRDIAKCLSDLDRKIELNKQINDNLEAQLRLITSRYIFSCPILEKKRIGEIATVKAGGDCPITFSKTRTQKCNIPIFSNGTEDRGLYGFTNKANIEGHSITVAARGTIGYCERRLMPFVPIIRLLAITPKEDGAYIYLHQVIGGMKFKKNGSVQQQLTVPEISFVEIPYPHSGVLHEYNKVASPIVKIIERNISENEILTKQRDELLPLLMNGQASVNYHLSVNPTTAYLSIRFSQLFYK